MFFYSWKHGGVIINCTLNENQSRVRRRIQVVSETKAWKNARNDQMKMFYRRKNRNFHILGVNKDSSLLSKDFKVYSWSHLLKILKIRVRPQKEKKNFANQTTEKDIWQFWTSKGQPAQSGKVFKGMFYKEKTEALEKIDTESMDEWSLERKKEQDPRWERVERCFW